MLGFIKIAAEVAISIGTSTVISPAIKQLTPDNLGRVKKICVPIASFAISGAVAKAASNYVNGQIDEVTDAITESKTIINENK